jgi:hypothetical protein
VDRTDKEKNEPKLDKLTLLQIVAFCVLMQNGEGIKSKAPDYIRQKIRRCMMLGTRDDVRAIMDLENQRIFDDYFESWGRIS